MKAPNSDSPSRRADSKMAMGCWEIKVRHNTIAMICPPVTQGRMSASGLFLSPRSEIRTNRGVSVRMDGIIIMDMITMNRASLPGKRMIPNT